MKRYYVEKRKGWFNGPMTHCVKVRDMNGAVLCISTEWSCQLVADVMNDQLGEG